MNGDRFCFAVGVHGQVQNLRTLRALRQVVFLVSGHTGHGKALHKAGALGTVAVDEVVDRSVVPLLVHAEVQNIRADKLLGVHFGHHEGAVLANHQDIVQVRTIADVLVALQARTHEAFFAVHVELGISNGHFCGYDGVKASNFRLALAARAVLLLQVLKVVHGVVHQVVQVLLDLSDAAFEGGELIVRFVAVKFGDALDFYFGQTDQIVFRHFAQQMADMGL